MERKIQLGIIGIGNIGTNHASNICNKGIKGVTLAAVCDIDENRREFAEKNYPNAKIFDDAQELMKSGVCDSVIIATPHYSHPTLAIKAFEYGLNVLIEKPAGVYTKQVMEMNEVAAKSGKVFAIMYNQRINPVYIKLRDMIKNGELGDIKRVNWTITDWYRSQAYHDSSDWRSTWGKEGGGALINQNPHQLDLWQWLFKMPDRIMAHSSFGKYYDIEVEDDVTAYMEYDNGMTGTYITSTGEVPGTNRLEIACDMGKVVVENNVIIFNKNTVSEREFNKNNTAPFGKPECIECKVPANQDGGPQHSGVIEAFANAILNRGDLVAKGEEGICGLTISNAIHLSSWTGKWVDLNNFPHDEYYCLLNEKIKNSTYTKNVKKVISELDGTFWNLNK